MTVEKIYHVETQEDYDSLMIELESKGYTWGSGKKLSEFNRWVTNEENTYVRVSENGVTFGDARFLFIGDCNFETYKAPQVVVNPLPTTEREAYKVLANGLPDTAQGIATKLRTLYSNGGKIDTPKKVTVPKVFDDWVEQDICDDKIESFLEDYSLDCLSGELDDWYEKNKETFYRAILDGYEVEKEKLYNVQLNGSVGLAKRKDGKVTLINDYSGNGQKILITKLTEKEIKDYNEGYWIGGFAKEVTE